MGRSGRLQSEGQQPENVVDKKGQGVRSSATAPPGPNSRPRQRTPFNWLRRSGNQGESREPRWWPQVWSPANMTKGRHVDDVAGPSWLSSA